MSLSPNVTMMETQTTVPTPKIFIDPPASSLKKEKPAVSPKDEPDLINLESVKNTPVRVTTSSQISDVLQDITNEVDVHTCKTELLDENIISPPPIEEDSLDSPSKKSLDSRGSIDSYVHPKHSDDESDIMGYLSPPGDTDDGVEPTLVDKEDTDSKASLEKEETKVDQVT